MLEILKIMRFGRFMVQWHWFGRTTKPRQIGQIRDVIKTGLTDSPDSPDWGFPSFCQSNDYNLIKTGLKFMANFCNWIKSNKDRTGKLQ